MRASVQERVVNGSIPVTETGCWLWERSYRTNGYGAMTVNGKALNAHRASYEAFKGECPPGLYILHQCNTRECVNPDHLRAGTQKQNIADMDRSGRRGDLKGEKHPLSKFTEAQIVEIRNRAAAGETQRNLAKEFGVWQTAISHIVTRKRWGHI